MKQRNMEDQAGGVKGIFIKRVLYRSLNNCHVLIPASRHEPSEIS
jgi:hypothetical protein